MSNRIDASWRPFTDREFKLPYFMKLSEFLHEEYRTHTIYPKKENVFKAFELVPYDKIKVVILGQDPYHQPHQAMGLSFSVPTGVRLPPSLVNIFKECETDLGIHNTNGDLTPWAKQGVFLLNTVLTVREGQANSHQYKGWEFFTDHVIEYLSRREKPIVFILWGNAAIRKKAMIASHHICLTSAHPSPLSAYRGFFGSHVFSKTNEALRQNHEKEIDWSV